MTHQEHIAMLRAKLAALEKNNPAMEIAVRTTISDQATRIFVEGKKSDGSLIGQYNSTKPLYVNPKNSPVKFKPEGKSGIQKSKQVFSVKTKRASKTESAHKTKWFDSYKSYRKTIGRKTDKVNLVLSGDLQSDFSNSPTAWNQAPHPIPHKKTANSFYVAITRPKDIKKMEGMEDKYGTIFKLTKEEKAGFKDILTQELRLLWLTRL